MFTEIIGSIQELDSNKLDLFYYKECNGVYFVDGNLLEIISTPHYCKQIRWFTERSGDSAIYEYRTRINNRWSKWIRVLENIYEGRPKPDNLGSANFDDLDKVIDRVNEERRYNDTNLRNSINNYVESHELGLKLSRKVSQPRHPNNIITFKGPLRLSENLHFFNEPWNSGGTMGVMLDGTYRFFSFHGGHQGRIQFGNEHTNLVTFRAGREDTLCIHDVAGNGDTHIGNRWILTTSELDWKTFWDHAPGTGSTVEPINAGFRPGDGDREIIVTQIGRGYTGKNIWFNVHGPEYTLVSTMLQTHGSREFNYEPGHNARYVNRELRINYNYPVTYHHVSWTKLHWR
nr:MAG TPA: hypothetical protein [Caudoviricetes sp.]